jgi:hypothetical protein
MGDLRAQRFGGSYAVSPDVDVARRPRSAGDTPRHASGLGAVSEENAMSDAVTIRHFVTYSGIRPPARMIEPLGPADLANRNTFVRARYDVEDRQIGRAHV